MHTLELVVQEFMVHESVKPWLDKIKGLSRHLKISMCGWSCFEELCVAHGLGSSRPPVGGKTRWGGHHLQVLWHTARETPVCEYYTEGPKAAVWLMDFEYPHLTGVGKCELNAWEWDYSKFACATLSILYDSTLLMQGTQYPTSNLVMPQLYQMIHKLSISSITYVHTGKKETMSIDEVLSSSMDSQKMKLIVAARSQMVENIYARFDTNLSESHRAKLYICTILDPRFKKYQMWPTRKSVKSEYQYSAI